MTAQRNVILLGGPGAGKGTQAERIVADFALPHISTGEMLRAAVAKGTEMGREAQKYMESGALVPDEVVIGVVRERLAEPDAARGLPARRLPAHGPSGRGARRHAGRGGQGDHARGAHRRARRGARAAHRRPPLLLAAAARSTTSPSTRPRRRASATSTARELTQRADDNEETVRNRIAVYEQQTAPLIGYYESKGVLKNAFGGGKRPDEVYEQVRRILAD